MSDPLCHGTTVTYNGITIRNVLTENISSETVYDRTGVDPIGVRTVMTFVGEMTGIYLSTGTHEHGYVWAAPSQTDADLAPNVHDAIRKFLVPRQQLTVTFGQDVLFSIRPGGVAGCGEPAPVGPVGGPWRNLDIANGPRTTCQVLAVKAHKSAKCRFTVDFTTPLECSDASGYILNVRWRVADDIDCQSWLTRRTYEGAIRFRCRDIDANPHAAARSWAFPPLLRGFRRESISYHEDPNALEVSFVVVDQEVFAAAPSPATFWDGTYTVAMAKHATMCTQDLSFTLKGDKTLPKSYLMTLAMYIIDSKMSFRLNRAPGEPAPNQILTSAVFQERLAKNEVTVSVQTLSTGPSSFLANLSQDPKTTNPNDQGFTLCQPLKQEVSAWPDNPRFKYYDPEVTTIPGAYSAGVSILLCALQTPCCPEAIANAEFATIDPLPTDASYSQPASPLPIVYNRDKALYSEQHNKASYEYYRMSSDLVGDTGWRAFPLGTQCSESSSQPSVAFVHLHCPVQIRKVTINAMRINAWPELPKPVHWNDDSVTPAIKHVLKHYTIEPMPVQLSADGCDTIHEVVATYWYYLDKPYQVTSAYKMPVGRLPFVDKVRLAAQTQHKEGTIDGDKRAIAESFFLDPKELLATVQ